MAKMKEAQGRGDDGRVPGTMFRLEEVILTILDEIAAHMAADLGTPISRTAALRVAVVQYAASLRRKKSKKSSG